MVISGGFILSFAKRIPFYFLHPFALFGQGVPFFFFPPKGIALV